MTDTNVKLLGTAGLAAAVALTGSAAVALASAPEAPVAIEQASVATAGAQVKAAQVAGTFSFAQGVVTPTAEIQKTLGAAPMYLCGAQGTTGEAQGLQDWTLTVNGDVQTPICAPLADLAEDGALTVTMGCSCAGNPADGRASANAAVTGITFESLYHKAGVSEDCNTVTFTSADGYSVSLPLAYVAQRYSLIVFCVNGQPIADSMGGTNQLWLGSTSARYFARDIVEITFSHQQTPPPAPGSMEAYANTPNVSVTSAE